MQVKSVFKTSIMLLAFLCLSPFLKAQFPPPPPGDPDPGQGTSVPLDGGITMLVAAGIGYAVKKRHDKRKDGKNVTNELK